MKGDFSRSSFDPSKHYTSVRMQQGRVHLDADWNEQADILYHAHCTQLRDLIGSDGGRPVAQPGFVLALPEPAVTAQATAPQTATMVPDLQISAGHRYVDGILCVNEQPCTLRTQPDFPGSAQHLPVLEEKQRYLFYLDVWQHHITALEDPDLRELALVGPDSTTRTKTVWQVKGWPIAIDLDLRDETAAWAQLWATFQQEMVQEKGRLAARKNPAGVIVQNQLYRVEIHSNSATAATFKWSRENGTVVYGVEQIKRDQTSDTAFLIKLKPTFADQMALQSGDLVEISSDEATLNGMAGIIGKLEIDAKIVPWLRVTTSELLLPADKISARPERTVLRRWDHQHPQQVALPLQRGQWLTLEDGLEIQFPNTGSYRTGDYWLIPIRANPDDAGGSVLWPAESEQPPHGINHHYAPLALLHQPTAGEWQLCEPPAVTFAPLPQLTDQVAKLAQRMTAAETALTHLRDEHDALVERVDKLEKRVERIEAYWAEERTQLYQDLAAGEQLEAGTVVALRPSQPDQVEKAQLGNATLLYGVVKEQGKDGRYRVVMQGRVQCQVVDEVAPGDLLVPSNYPGRARKAGLFVQPGTVLGRALSAQHYQPGTDFGVVDAVITLS